MEARTTLGERRGDIRMLFDYIHKLASIVMVGLLGWAGVSINQGNIQIALLTQRVEQIAEQMRSVSAEKYSAADAVRDFALRDQRLGNIERIIQRE